MARAPWTGLTYLCYLGILTFIIHSELVPIDTKWCSDLEHLCMEVSLRQPVRVSDCCLGRDTNPFLRLRLRCISKRQGRESFA